MTHALNTSRKQKFFGYFERMKIKEKKKHGIYNQKIDSLQYVI